MLQWCFVGLYALASLRNSFSLFSTVLLKLSFLKPRKQERSMFTKIFQHFLRVCFNPTDRENLHFSNLVMKTLGLLLSSCIYYSWSCFVLCQRPWPVALVRHWLHWGGVHKKPWKKQITGTHTHRDIIHVGIPGVKHNSHPSGSGNTTERN